MSGTNHRFGEGGNVVAQVPKCITHAAVIEFDSFLIRIVSSCCSQAEKKKVLRLE